MKTNQTDFRPENRDGQPRMTRMARMKRNFSTELPETRERDFEQEATPINREQAERTEIRKGKSLCPAYMEICGPLIGVMSSFDSALGYLRCLLFKPIWLRSSL